MRMLATGIGVLARPGIQDQSRKSGKSFERLSKCLEANRDFRTFHFELQHQSLGVKVGNGPFFRLLKSMAHGCGECRIQAQFRS